MFLLETAGNFDGRSINMSGEMIFVGDPIAGHAEIDASDKAMFCVGDRGGHRGKAIFQFVDCPRDLL